MTGFVQKLHAASASAPSRESMIAMLIDNGQFLIGEQPKVVRNGLSTDLLVFPSDLHPAHRGLLHEKVNAAIEYAASFTDVERLNALQYLPGAYKQDEDSQGRWYLTLGLYLYFADECSRKNPNTTFLSALRDAGATLPGDQEFNPAVLFSCVRTALALAGIDSDQNKKVLVEWARQGTYTIEGHTHRCVGEGGQVEGAYAQLAAKLVEDYHHLHKRGIIVGVNQAISYALGNKDHMLGFGKDDAAAYAHVKETINNPTLIKQHVDQGCHIRHHRIWDIINNSQPPLFGQADVQTAKTTQDAQRSVAESILSYYPPEALELMLRERQTFVYSDKENIRDVFPAGDIPSQQKEQSDASRSGIAVRMNKYRTTFFSNGEHKDADRVDAKTKYMRVAQSSLHELMHIAYGMMTEEEKAHLTELAEKVSLQLRNYDGRDFVMPDGQAYFYTFFTAGGKIPDRTEALEVRSLPEILDYKSNLYNGYRRNEEKPSSLDTRIEEVICNTYGFIHTEFKEFKDRTNPQNHIFYPPEGLESMREFAEAVDTTFKAVVERVRHEKDIPHLSQGHGR